MIVLKQENLSIKINESNSTADIVYSPKSRNFVVIQRSIIYQSNDYVIKTITENSFKDNRKIKSIEFSDDSELQTIQNSAFSGSSLKFLSIPATVTNLEEGWCIGAAHLIEITLSPLNNNFSYSDDIQKILTSKSNSKSKIFDVIIFACRDVNFVEISSQITEIGSHSFSDCKCIEKVEFSKESELKIIGKESFSNSSVDKILIPNRVKKICESSFLFCECLEKVEFERGSELDSIGKESFSHSSLETIFIPNKVSEICESAFSWCEKLKTINFSDDSNLNSIGNDAFAYSGIEFISIPKKVTHIGESSFAWCEQLQTVDFSQNSSLKKFEKNLFFLSSIEFISIPPSVTEICEKSFESCEKLNQLNNKEVDLL